MSAATLGTDSHGGEAGIYVLGKVGIRNGTNSGLIKRNFGFPEVRSPKQRNVIYGGRLKKCRDSGWDCL